MPDFLEICARMFSGPMMNEKKFDTQVFFPVLKKIIPKYGLKYTPEVPVNFDDGLVEAAFEGAVTLLATAGLYSPDTQRVITFSREEVMAAVKEAPGPCYFGEGRDARLFTVRKPEDFIQRPWCHIGGGMHCSSDEIAERAVEGYARVDGADSVSMPTTLHLRDLPVQSGSPIGILAAIHSNALTRRVLARSGRPGMPILNLHPGAATAIETIAASLPDFGLRPTDGWLVGFPSEMKVDYGAMNKCAFITQIGGRIGSQGAPLLGGYCGGPEGTALTSIAYALAGILAMKASYHLSYPLDITLRCSTTRQLLWVVSLSCQAISRYLAIPLISLAHTAAGPLTEMYFYEAAAHMLASIPSGASVQSPMAGTGKGKKLDFQTPVEGDFCARFIPAAQKITRQEAAELVSRLLTNYEGTLAAAPEGRPYQEYYDLRTGRLKEEHQSFYQKMIARLRSMGLEIQE